TLVDKSLLTISSTMVLQMHGLTQAMAREIVREESDRPGDRSRLWITSEVTEAIEVLVLLLENSIQNVHIDLFWKVESDEANTTRKTTFSDKTDFVTNSFNFRH
ncbi:hypothetical protein Tco_0101418, partial [Tanacetum coccineum]